VSAGAARRYARALLDVATGEADARALALELESARALLAGQKDLRQLFANRALSAERKKKMVAAVWSEARASLLMRRLLELLAERDRLTLLGAIAENYRLMLLAQENVAAAEVVSAVALDAEQQHAVAKAVETALGRKVEIRATVDADLLGGVLVKIGGRHYDGSVRGRLRALRANLAGA
jgi:F-type H+-transporting ATPase subunit delta